MGVCKGPVYNAVRDAMTTVLTDVYRNVYNFEPNFVSKIMTIFGSDYGGIDMGMYAHIAKLLEQANQLDLFDKVKKMNFSTEADELAFVLGKLRGVPGMSSACIDFFVEQYKTYELFIIMSRMEKFRAGCRLQYIAAQMPNTRFYSRLPSHIKAMIKTIATKLGKKKDQVFDSLKRIKKAQSDGGDRLSLLNKLASLYNKKGGEEGEGLNAITEDSRLGELVSLMSGDTTMAIDAIVKLASRCDKTFWNNFEKLKKYRKDYPDDVVEVEVNREKVKVLTIDTNKYSRLHDWLVMQNGHRAEYGVTSDNDDHWGIKAYERMGSIEQLALSGIDVTFIPALHQKAMIKRDEEKQTKADMEKTGGLRSSLFSIF